MAQIKEQLYKIACLNIYATANEGWFKVYFMCYVHHLPFQLYLATVWMYVFGNRDWKIKKPEEINLPNDYK